MENTSIGCAGLLVVGAFVASVFGFGGGVIGNFGVLIFVGGLVLCLLLYGVASQRPSTFRTTAPPNFKLAPSQTVRDQASSRNVHNQDSSQSVSDKNTVAAAPVGCVYLLKAGPFYKIGKSQLFEQRLKQIRQQLPYPVEVVHVFETDRMFELEVYWHRRFQARRTHSDWFILTDEDVHEFTQQV